MDTQETQNFGQLEQEVHSSKRRSSKKKNCRNACRGVNFCWIWKLRFKTKRIYHKLSTNPNERIER